MINVFPPLCNIISLNLNDFGVLLVAVHLFWYLHITICFNQGHWWNYCTATWIVLVRENISLGMWTLLPPPRKWGDSWSFFFFFDEIFRKWWKRAEEQVTEFQWCSRGTLTFDPLKIMLLLLHQKKGVHMNLINKKGDFNSRNNTFFAGKVCYFTPKHCLRWNKMIILGGGGGQSAVNVDTASLKLKQFVSISSQHLSTCLFYCGESEPRGFNKVITSV